MSSNTRQQLNIWLKTLDIQGSVLDVGGLHLPVKGRTKSWDVPLYEILDIEKNYKGIKANYVKDLNMMLDHTKQYDNVFCLEVMEYVYDSMMVLRNLNWFLKKGGHLFISTHFIFPEHSGGEDLMRYTRKGIQKLLTKTGFEIKSVTPRLAVKNFTLAEILDFESKVQYSRGEIGHLIEAIKC